MHGQDYLEPTERALKSPKMWRNQICYFHTFYQLLTESMDQSEAGDTLDQLSQQYTLTTTVTKVNTWKNKMEILLPGKYLPALALRAGVLLPGCLLQLHRLLHQQHHVRTAT